MPSMSRLAPLVAPAAIAALLALPQLHCARAPLNAEERGADPTSPDEAPVSPTSGAADATSLPPPDVDAAPADAGPSDADAETVDACAPGAAVAGAVDVPLVLGILGDEDALPFAVTGGDPSGAWRAVGATAFVSARAGRIVSVSGSVRGWAEFVGADARVFLRASVTVSALGKTAQNSGELGGRGKVTINGADMTMAWACPQDGGLAAESTRFVRSGDTAKLVRRMTTQLGDVFLVVDAVRVP
jgi:hypothetical protein